MDIPRVRLFFALWPDASVRGGLAQWQQSLRPLCGGRAMHIDDVHLTLAFLGDTPVERLDVIKEAAAGVVGRPFHLRIDEAQYWRHNKIVWGGTQTVPDALAELVGSLRTRLTQASIPFDGKPFVTHITLFRNARPIEAMPSLPAIDWPAERFALISSRGGGASRYRVEANWPLLGTPGAK